MCAIALGCVSLAGCGDRSSDSTASARAGVRDYLPEARAIDCRPQTHGAHCDVLVGRPPGGLAAWTCEFAFASSADEEAYSGSDSCWTENGTAQQLHMQSH